MATATIKLIQALRRTTQNLERGVPYMWGHMGACNCGNLAQELTQLTKADIHAFAMQGRGDWREQVEEYCPVSGLPMDLLIADLLQYGLTTTDLQHLEALSDPRIKQRIPMERRNQMRHNVREDVILYMQTWATLLEEEWLETVSIPAFSSEDLVMS